MFSMANWNVTIYTWGKSDEYSYSSISNIYFCIGISLFSLKNQNNIAMMHFASVHTGTQCIQGLIKFVCPNVAIKSNLRETNENITYICNHPAGIKY